MQLSRYLEGLLKPHYPKAIVHSPRIYLDLNETPEGSGRISLSIGFSIVGYKDMDMNLAFPGSIRVVEYKSIRTHYPNYHSDLVDQIDVYAVCLYGSDTAMFMQQLAGMFKVQPAGLPQIAL